MKRGFCPTVRPDGGETYQVAPHSGGVPLGINGPQEAQQQGVAHPLAPMVAAVALPATREGGKKIK